MSKRHSNGDSGSPYEPATGPGNARTVANPGSIAAESESGRLDANRNANIAFAQRSKVETAKTTTKRAALVANAVQKTPTYPIDENHAQSTTTVVMRPSAKSNTMAAIGTPKASPEHAPSHSSGGPSRRLATTAVVSKCSRSRGHQHAA